MRTVATLGGIASKIMNQNKRRRSTHRLVVRSSFTSVFSSKPLATACIATKGVSEMPDRQCIIDFIIVLPGRPYVIDSLCHLRLFQELTAGDDFMMAC